MKKKENKRAKSQEQRAKGEELRAESREQGAKGKEQPETSNQQPRPTTCPTESFRRGSSGRAVASDQQPRPTGSSGRAAASKISTVYNIKKPSAIEFYVPAEDCISGSRAVRACLMIRVFNN